MKITRNTKRSAIRKPTIACSKKRVVKSTNRKVKSACGKKSVKSAMSNELYVAYSNGEDSIAKGRTLDECIKNLLRKVDAEDIIDWAIYIDKYVDGEWVESFKETDVYDMASGISAACGKKSVKASRRPVRASRTLEIYTYGELTPEQQDYVVEHWDQIHPIANTVYEWYNADVMDRYHDGVNMLAEKYSAEGVNEYKLGIHTDKLYWEESSQGPYPEWDLSRVFDTYYLDIADGVEVSIGFNGKSTDVDADVEINAYDSDEYVDDVVNIERGDTEPLDLLAIPEDAKLDILHILQGAQDFIDEVWGLINEVCWDLPYEDWVRDMLANNDVFDYIIDDDGTVDVIR